MGSPKRPYHETPTETHVAEIDRLGKELIDLRGRPRRFKADAHAAVDHSVEAARKRFAALLRDSVNTVAHSAGTPVLPAGIGDAWVTGFVPETAERWHAAIDAAPADSSAGSTFSAIDRPEFEAKRRTLETAIEARREELRLRGLEHVRDAANAELGATTSAVES
jgi:hypothetical protein